MTAATSAAAGEIAASCGDEKAGGRGEQTEAWMPLPGWGDSYLVEVHSGRVRSRDRWIVNTYGQRRRLSGVELKPCGRSQVVTLSHRSVRRTFAPDALRRMVQR